MYLFFPLSWLRKGKHVAWMFTLDINLLWKSAAIQNSHISKMQKLQQESKNSNKIFMWISWAKLIPAHGNNISSEYSSICLLILLLFQYQTKGQGFLTSWNIHHIIRSLSQICYSFIPNTDEKNKAQGTYVPSSISDKFLQCLFHSK